MKSLSLIIAFITHLLVLTGTSRADVLDLERMVQAGDVSPAIEQLMPLADHGDVKAQELLSDIFLHYIDDAPDVDSAIDWLRRAAPVSAALQFQLYDLLTKHRKTPENQEERLSLLKQSAEAGYAVAQAHLGMHYAIGTELEVDLRQSLKWLFLASKHMPADSTINMLEALSWVAAQLGHSDLAAVEQQVQAWHDDYTNRRAKDPLPLLETPLGVYRQARLAVSAGQRNQAEVLFSQLATAGDKDSQGALDALKAEETAEVE